jgi:hypothetical protein
MNGALSQLPSLLFNYEDLKQKLIFKVHSYSRTLLYENIQQVTVRLTAYRETNGERIVSV